MGTEMSPSSVEVEQGPELLVLHPDASIAGLGVWRVAVGLCFYVLLVSEQEQSAVVPSRATVGILCKYHQLHWICTRDIPQWISSYPPTGIQQRTREVNIQKEKGENQEAQVGDHQGKVPHC
ncbi:hypothetical protein Nepgr_021053 [Nepenthes gracilis]|uniref:Uncharacterized protein n=1 Tax=Nepenthes gracilis TaxID=150966 RepID=A0AAD3XVL9_NEPGR|nr:hypothetical protein Nepgr_021053 [Nepenthes gracilis]